MGWLRDLMRQAPEPLRSLSEVARRALAHPDWTDSGKPQERSLAALFSKLDRGLELEWLADRPAVQQVLAQVLGAPRSRIAEAVGSPTDGGVQRRVRLDDVPYAAAIDLTEERLPPGIPESVTHPSEWPLWWIAPSGSGRSLAGSWLAVRGTAAHVAARTWPEALAAIPARGAVFVELLAHEGPCPAPPRKEICVAAPANADALVRAGWTAVATEPPAAWLEPLVKWLARRLPRDGHFTPDGALEWLKGELARGFVDGFGTALGLAGLVDRYGSQELSRAGLSRTATRFIRESVARAGEQSGPDTSFVEDNAVDILRLLARGLFVDSREPWGAPRPLEEWVRLVPSEYQQGLDAEWVRVSVSRRARAPTVEELERSMRELPPGGFRVVSTLERAGLLRRAGPDSLALGPRWLARWLEEDALGAIVEAKPENWGEALLLAPGAPAVARGIVEHALVGDSSIYDDVLDTTEEEESREKRSAAARSPAAVAALEMAFRAAGLAVLVRGDIDGDVLLALWERQLDSVIERDDGPHPSIGYDPDVTASEPLLEVGVFRLAALALSECLPAKSGGTHPLLRPWTGAPSAETFRPVLDSIHHALSRFDPAEARWALEAYALGMRLYALFEQEDGPLPPHPLAWPGLTARHIERRSLDWASFRAGATERALRALFLLAAEAKASEASVSRAVWLAFCAAKDRIDASSPLWPDSPLGSVFWKHAPTAALATVMARKLIDPRALPLGRLDDDQWRAVFDANPAALAGVGAPLSTMPAVMVKEAVERAPFEPDDLSALWARSESALLDAVGEAAARGSPRLSVLLASSPADRTAVITARLSVELHRGGAPGGEAGAGSLPFASVSVIKEFLHDRVRARAPGFRPAFELLSELG